MFIRVKFREPRPGAKRCGEDKIPYGGETPIWHPRWALEAFWSFELPQDIEDGYGCGQLTAQAKRKILGEISRACTGSIWWRRSRPWG